MHAGRLPTGVGELDRVLGGGYPAGSRVLLAGGPGLGKTTLALAFVAEGAAQGEPADFVAIAGPARRALQATVVPHPVERLAKEGVLRVLQADDLFGGPPPPDADAEDGQQAAAALGEAVRERGVTRLAVDSLTALGQLAGPDALRGFLFHLDEALGADCTAIMVSETPPRDLAYSMFEIEELVADGILFLSELDRHNDVVRTLQVVKMAGTDHPRSRFLLDLSPGGISLGPLMRKVGELG